MRSREIVRSKLERLESNLSKLDFILKRNGNINEYLEVTEYMKQLIDELKSYVEYEPRTGEELNTSI
jgi:hypothetical protein